MLYAIVALLVIIGDQWLKYWVSTTIALECTGVPLIPGVLSLVNLHNDGCALSLLSGGGARIYFIILTGIFTVAVLIALGTHFISGRVSRWSIVLVTAGGLSNCIDRIIYGYVQDMFKLELFNFPIFNIADIFITICCIIFVFAIIFEKDKKDEYDDEFVEDDDEEEDRPRRRSGRRNAEAEPEEKVPAKPLKGRKKSVDNYEQYKAAKAARQQNAAPAAQNAAAPRRARNTASADPFAEWEKANAKVEAQQKNSYAAKAAGVNPTYQRPQSRYAAAAQQQRRPAPQQQTVPRTAQPASRAAQPSASAAPQRRAAVPPQYQRPQAPQQSARPAEPEMPVFDFDDIRPSAAPVQSAPAAETQRPVKPQAPQQPAAEPAEDFSLDDILNEFK